MTWDDDRDRSRRRAEQVREPGIDAWVRDLRREVVEVEDRAAVERARERELRDLLDRRYELLMELEDLQRDRIEAERKARQIEKRVEARERRNEERAAKVDGPRRGRPVRIDVDDEAWATVKREALRRRYVLVWVIGDLVRSEVEALAFGEAVGTPASRRRRSPGESTLQPRRRFARIDVDDEHWVGLRTAAFDVGLTVGRYVGEIVEASAYESGWRSRPIPLAEGGACSPGHVGRPEADHSG